MNLAIGVTALLGFNFPGTLAVKKKKRRRIFNEWCVHVPNGLGSLTNTRKYLIFTWVSSIKYFCNISGHMVLIILYIFSAAPFTSIFQPEGLNLSDL